MAGVQARKEEEKKRESHKQTIHKVPVCSDLLLSVCLDLEFKYRANTHRWTGFQTLEYQVSLNPPFKKRMFFD